MEKGHSEQKSEDYLMKMNLDTPLDFIRPIQNKLCIKNDELSSQPKFQDILTEQKIAEEVGTYGKLFDVSGYMLDSKRSYKALQRTVNKNNSSTSAPNTMNVTFTKSYGTLEAPYLTIETQRPQKSEEMFLTNKNYSKSILNQTKYH